MLNPKYDVNELPTARFFLMDDFGKELLDYFVSNPVPDFNPIRDYEANKDQIQNIINGMPLRLGHDAHHLPLSPVDVYYINRKLHESKDGFSKTFLTGSKVGAINGSYSFNVSGPGDNRFPFIFSVILREAAKAGFDIKHDGLCDIEQLFALGLFLSDNPRDSIAKDYNYNNILKVIIGVINRYHREKYLLETE